MYIITILIVLVISLSSCENSKDDHKMQVEAMESGFVAFAGDLESRLAETYTNWSLAYWDATLNSSQENWSLVTQAEIAMNNILTEPGIFDTLKEYRESQLIEDPILQRRLLVLYNAALEKQADLQLLSQIVELQNNVQGKYSEFRAVVNGKEVTDNEIEYILKSSRDNETLRQAWLAHKNIGPMVAEDILKLVEMRNQVANSIGFDNYHQMSLELSQQNADEIETLFDELDNLTRDSYNELKHEIDEFLSKRYNVAIEELMPWHYQNRFFQEAPQIYHLDLDIYYENQDIAMLSELYFNSIGLPVDRILANSDLYEKEGKNQHAYCINVDRNKEDIRIFCNIVPNARWMDTQLHELGHAVYEDYYLPELPWNLKTAAHSFTTEAIAMIFGRMASSPQWMKDMGVINASQVHEISEKAHKITRMQQLVFSRWVQVMYRFEKGMYENPNQDLNKLWWDLVEKYQGMSRPEERDMPDWATKIHIAAFPCYYHNYLMGELLASQFYYTIAEQIYNTEVPGDLSFYGNAEVGKYFITNVFNPGAKYPWNEMIEKATGKPLTAVYYAKQYVD